MKKLIFRNIFKDITTLFVIISLALTLIVWVIQAVNYLDIVSEDGHNFSVYFKFSLLSLPKIFNKLMLFVFFCNLWQRQQEQYLIGSSAVKIAAFKNHHYELTARCPPTLRASGGAIGAWSTSFKTNNI